MADDPQEAVDWTGVEPAMVERILQQGETFMSAQLQAALAADSRATTMAGIFVTLALAVVAGGVAWGGWQFWTAGFVTGGLLLAASYRAAWAARPIDFYFPGNQPSQWWPNRHSDLVGMLGGEAENYEARIEANQKTLAENQGAIHDAFALALCSPLAGAIVWLLATWISSPA